MEPGEPDYVDAAAESMPAVVCRRCDGDGWYYRQTAAMIGGRLTTVAKPEPCPECASGEDRVPTGRVNSATGPGAKLKRWEKVPVPGVDDWGPDRA